MKCLVLLMCLIAVGICEDKQCCFPDRMTAFQGLVIGQVVGGKPQAITGTTWLAMDATIRKANSYITLVVDGNTIRERVIQNFSQKTQYLIVNNVCTKSVLGDWKAPCLSNDSYLYDTYVGAAPNTLPARLYQVQEGDVTAYVTTTSENECVPLTEAVYGTKNGASFASTLSFMNVTRSVPDPSVFDVPSICDNAPTVPRAKSPGGGMIFH